MYSKILIAVDSSAYSLVAARKGLDLAHQLNAQAALVFVINMARTIHSADVGILPEEAIVVLKKEAEETLDQILAMYNGKGVLKFMPEGRHPADDIMKTAELWEADLIVMGSHHSSAFTRLITHSVTEQVVHHSQIPVVIVPSR